MPRWLTGFVRNVNYLIFHTFNPLRVWRDERALDRDAMVLMVTEVCSTLKEQSISMQANTKMVESFLHSFQTVGEPERRVVSAEDELNAYVESLGISREQFESLQSLSV